MTRTIDLDVPLKPGEPSLRDTIIQAGDVIDDDLMPPKIPMIAEHALRIYWELAGGDHLGAAEIEAYCRITGEVIEPWEARMILKLDRSARAHALSRVRK